MPDLVAPLEIPRYIAPPPTEAELEYADLPVIDLSKAATPEGRLALAQQVQSALTEHGFLCVVNHGYTAAQTQRIFDIADIPFSQVSEAEKHLYRGSVERTGAYQGYKLREYWHINNGVRDQVEHYNINRNVTKYEHPEALRPLLPEIQAFARHTHENVLHPILRLMAIGLQLPEETLVNLHGFSAVGESSVRFMKYHPRSEEDELKSKNVWLKGHTDIGSITILYSQPIAALQILTKDGTWKWVKHIENGLVINTGDVLEFLSGGLYRPTIHRVVQPPADQQHYTRLGVFYFAMMDDDVKLEPLLESPVLQRVGITRSFGDAEPMTMEAWRKSRTTAYGTIDLKPAENGTEDEIVNGVVVKHYN